MANYVLICKPIIEEMRLRSAKELLPLLVKLLPEAGIRAYC